MRTLQPHRRRASASFWLGLLLILLVGSSGLAAVLLLLGVNLNPFATSRPDPYMVRIPINSRPIKAYERVAREDLLKPGTGDLMYQLVPPSATVGMSITGVTSDGSQVASRIEKVRNDHDQVVFVVSDGREIPQAKTMELGGALMNVNAIIGRVVKKDKRAGLGFRENTFFPEGTPEGIGGATPPGMRAVTLDATKLTGVYALNAGDVIDLMASVPVGEVGTFQSQYNSNWVGAPLVASPTTSKTEPAKEPILLARSAVVLKPVYIRYQSVVSPSLTQGNRVQNIPKYEVALAVAPDDVIPLQSALIKSLDITCISHPMQSGADDGAMAADKTPSDELQVPVTVRAILAYDVVSREAFVSPATRQMRMTAVNRRQIQQQGIITSLDEALGSLARHDIPAGRFLRRSDLLSGSVAPYSLKESVDPRQGTMSNHGARGSAYRFVSNRGEMATVQEPNEVAPEPSAVGSRPAVTRFVPPGFTAFAVPWNRMYGAEHLQIGDKIDLLASYSLDSENQNEETETRPDGTTIIRKRHDVISRKTMRTWDESFGLRGESWFVASDALVVGPVGFPAPAAAQRALGESLKRTPTSDADESLSGPPLILAVDDRDVESLATALATEHVLLTPAYHSSDEQSMAGNRMKSIAIAAQDLAAYEAYSDAIWNGNRRRPLSRQVSIDDPRYLKALSVEDMEQFVNRVLRRTKHRGDFFTAGDFLADGTRPGYAAAAGSGTTVFAIADREIEGLDAFQDNDRVAILVRGVVKLPTGIVTHGINLARPISAVIVPSATIVRASSNGRTVLEIPNADLMRFQAVWAASMLCQGAEQGDSHRSHLLAVALPRDSGIDGNQHAAGGAETRQSEPVVAGNSANALSNGLSNDSMPATTHWVA